MLQWSASHPARRCTSPLGVVPVGSGDGVGNCHDAANFPEKGPFISLVLFFLVKRLYSCFQTVWFLLGFTAGYASSYEGAHPYATVMHIRWVSLTGHFGRKSWQNLTVRPQFPPLYGHRFSG